MPPIICPLCSVALTSASLEAHLREELLYPSLRCLLCSAFFACEDTAAKHFAGPLARHPSHPPQLLHLQEDPVKEQRLVELVRLAREGESEVERRLCVCGQCRLLCREDFRRTSGGAEERAAQSFEVQSHRAQSYEASDKEPQRWGSSLMQDEPRVSPDKASKEDQSEKEQPMPEASESENQMPMDVKPSLDDLKPQLSADGKVACLQCGFRVGKDMFKKHAIGAHSNARPYTCNLCPHNEKNKSELSKHQRKEHGTNLSEDSFTFVGSESKLLEIVEQCFGAAENLDWARMRCMPCDKLINKMELKNHAAVQHLKKPLHSCKLCDHVSLEHSAGKMNRHVKAKHRVQPGPAAIDSSQAQHYAPIIKNMIPQLFSEK